MINKKIMLMGLCLVVSGLTFPRTLDLQGAIELGKTENKTIKIRKIETLNRELEIKKNRKEYLPEFIASTNYLPDENKDGDDGWGDRKITAKLPIYTGGRRSGKLARSASEEDLEIEKLKVLTYDIEKQVVGEYFYILNIKKGIEIEDMVINTLKKQRERLKEKYENGRLIPKSELLKVESDILKSESEKKALVEELESTKYAFKALLGVDLKEEIYLKDFEYESIDLKSFNIIEDVFKLREFSSRANIERLKVKIAESNLKIARSKLLPKINFKTDYWIDRGYSDYKDKNNDDFSVELAASWSIFKWGSDLDNYNQNKNRVKQSILGQDRELDRAEAELRNSYGRIRTFDSQVINEKKNIKVVTENLKIDTMRYDNGIISSFEYLNSVKKLANSETRILSLQRNLVLSTIRYEELLR